MNERVDKMTSQIEKASRSVGLEHALTTGTRPARVLSYTNRTILIRFLRDISSYQRTRLYPFGFKPCFEKIIY